MNFYDKIWKHPLANKVMALADQMLVSASNFLLGILLVRWLGLEDYGCFALLWMTVLFALGINQAWITKPLLSIAPKMDSKDQQVYLLDLHVIQILTGIFVLLLAYGLYLLSDLFWSSEVVAFIPLTSALIFCQLLHDFYRKVSLVRSNMLSLIFLDAIFYLGQLLCVVFLFYFGQLELYNLLLGLLSINLCSIFFGSIAVGIHVPDFIKLKNTILRHFHFSKWLLGTSVLQWLSGNYFIIVGASILGTVAVGAIRLVQNIMGLCHILFLTMENLVPIEAARQYHLEGENALIKYLRETTIKLGIAFALILTLIAVFAADILQLFYGAETIIYTPIVLAYVLLYVFVFLSHPFVFFMRTKEKTAPVFIAYVITVVFSLMLAPILVKQFGIQGLLFGLIASQIINVLTYYFSISPGIANRIMGLSIK